MADRLTALDASFLHLEDATSHMHVASVTIFDGDTPPTTSSSSAIERRLYAGAALPPEAGFVPLGQGRPVWVDDPHFNLEYHVRATALPPPRQRAATEVPGRARVRAATRPRPSRCGRSGSYRDSTAATAPRRGGDFALLSKTHHCLVDGVAGVDITAVLFDTAAEPTTPPDTARSGNLFRSPLPAVTRGRADRARDPTRRDGSSARSAVRAPRRVMSRGFGQQTAVGALARSGLGAPPSPFERRDRAAPALRLGARRARA